MNKKIAFGAFWFSNAGPKELKRLELVTGYSGVNSEVNRGRQGRKINGWRVLGSTVEQGKKTTRLGVLVFAVLGL